jgi:hypothetical protein
VVKSHNGVLYGVAFGIMSVFLDTVARHGLVYHNLSSFSELRTSIDGFDMLLITTVGVT